MQGFRELNHQTKKNMYYKLDENGFYLGLKQEQVYEVVGETEVEYVVVVERNRQVYFRKSRFVLESQQ